LFGIYSTADTITCDSGGSSIANFIDLSGMEHMRGAPHHPKTQGKIERWHHALKNRILLENYFLPGDLKGQIGRFVDYYKLFQMRHQAKGREAPQADVGLPVAHEHEEVAKTTNAPSRRYALPTR
jgi:putative transposase